jgi:Ni/Co efflux regulator RcnB
MRKTMLLLLLAGAAVPGIASARPFERPDDQKAEHSDRHADRQQQQQQEPQQQKQREVEVQRDESSRGSDRPHFSGYSNPNGDGEAAAQVRAQSDNGRNFEGRRQHFGGYQRGGGDEAVQPVAVDRSTAEPARNWSWRERRPTSRDQGSEEQSEVVQNYGGGGSLRQYDRSPPNVMRSRVPVTSDTPREGTQQRVRTEGRYGQYSAQNHHHWDGNWRNDRRFDWRDHRRRHGSLFHLGFYYDPFGWGYQQFQIGGRLWPNYYSANYWINDPYQYSLPYPPPGTRWVRYYNDALLVDTFSGEVVDVIRDFFW